MRVESKQRKKEERAQKESEKKEFEFRDEEEDNFEEIQAEDDDEPDKLTENDIQGLIDQVEPKVASPSNDKFRVHQEYQNEASPRKDEKQFML